MIQGFLLLTPQEGGLIKITQTEFLGQKEFYHSSEFYGFLSLFMDIPYFSPQQKVNRSVNKEADKRGAQIGVINFQNWSDTHYRATIDFYRF